MKHLLLLVGVLITFRGICQSEFDMPNTDPDAFLESILNAEKQGVFLLVAEPTPCNPDDVDINIKSRIAFMEWENDTLIIDVAFGEICCIELDTGIAISGDTLNLLYKPYGSGCFCPCCYHITYKIRSPKKRFSQYTLNGKIIVETDQVHKEETTQTEYYESGNKRSESRFLDGQLQVRILYDTSGTKITFMESYQNGKLVNTVDRTSKR